MAGRPTKLTPEAHRQIVAYIRAGAFEWVAAEAAGVSKSTFHRWMQRGTSETDGPYREFAEEVRQARAQARVAAEMDVRRMNPLAWLRFGPGRERLDEPGWTEQQQHEVTLSMRDQALAAVAGMTEEQLLRLAEGDASDEDPTG